MKRIASPGKNLIFQFGVEFPDIFLLKVDSLGESQEVKEEIRGG